MNRMTRSATGGRRTASTPRSRGIALVLVVWLLTLLTAIAAAFVTATRANTLVSANLTGLARWSAAADAGVYRAAFEMLSPATSPGRWRGDGLVHQVGFEDGSLEVAIVDETGKVDLNTANPELLRLVFVAAGLDDAQASALLDVLTDWRDADMLKRANGAEADDYAAAGSPYRPANALLQTVDEFRQLLGVTDALFQRLLPVVTVYSSSPGINPLFAPVAVLAALPGATAESASAYVAAREAALAAQQPAPDYPPARPFASNAGAGQAFSVRSTFVDANGTARFTREAVVRVPRDPRQGIAISAWRQINAQPAPAPAAGQES